MVLLAVLLGILVCSLMNGNSLMNGFPLIEGAGGAGELKEGVCRGLISNEQNKLCDYLSKKGEGECNTGEGKDVCTFRSSGDIKSYSGGLEGTIYDEWMSMIPASALNNQDLSVWARGWPGDSVIPPSPGLIVYPSQGDKYMVKHNVLRFSGNTDLLPLRIPDRGDCKPASRCNFPSPSSPIGREGGDFLKDVLGITKSSDVDDSPLIPSPLKDEVRDMIKLCESGWDTSDKVKEIYERANFGRPIMGYNESEGLVCRNPYHYPLVYPGSVPRLFTGPNGCPSPTNIMCERRASQCGWESTGMTNDFFSTITNNVPLSDSGACGLPACVAEYPGQCLKQSTLGIFDDASLYAYKMLPGAPGLG
tara:strand:- start:2944 stop:4032 length:1089 start_codon:yes stop_codon:yes gene_type:complete